jgi:hypothetical protein
MEKKVPYLWNHLKQWQETQIIIVQKLFKWLMTLFLGELPQETEYAVWDMFMVEGSAVLFRVAITILRLMEHKLRKEEEVNEVCTLEDTMMILTQFSKQEITRKILLKSLVKGEKKKQIEVLRNVFRKKVVEDLQKEMMNVQDKLFPRIHFLKRFILYDGLPRYHQDIKLQANLTDNG